MTAPRVVGWRGILIMVVFVVASEASAERLRLPGIKGADDRKLVEPTAYPWSSIGRVNRETGGFCTGTLVGPRHVLTAAHCLWNRRTRSWLRPSSLHFVAGYRRGLYVGHSRVGAYHVAEGYRPGKRVRDSGVAYDWAILTLAEALPGTVEALAIATLDRATVMDPRRSRVRLIQAGYSQDKAHTLSLHEDCRVLGERARSKILVHDCDATKGDSGSPILIRTNGSYRVIAMHVGTETDGSRTIGFPRGAPLASKLRSSSLVRDQSVCYRGADRLGHELHDTRRISRRGGRVRRGAGARMRVRDPAITLLASRTGSTAICGFQSQESEISAKMTLDTGRIDFANSEP